MGRGFMDVGELIGILTDSDVSIKVIASGLSLKQTPVSAVCRIAMTNSRVRIGQRARAASLQTPPPSIAKSRSAFAGRVARSDGSRAALWVIDTRGLCAGPCTQGGCFGERTIDRRDVRLVREGPSLR